MPCWVWLIVLIIAFIMMAMQGPKKVQPVASAPERISTMAFDPEDLTRIEGIGPKIKAGLREHGVSTFAQSAVMDVEALRAVLREIGIAADRPPGLDRPNWLQKLQENLMGGRVS